MNGPVYRFMGRRYKTVAGLSRALFADSGCDSHGMVDSERRITCTIGRGENRAVVAQYLVGQPVVGEPMNVERIL